MNSHSIRAAGLRRRCKHSFRSVSLSEGSGGRSFRRHRRRSAAFIKKVDRYNNPLLIMRSTAKPRHFPPNLKDSNHQSFILLLSHGFTSNPHLLIGRCPLLCPHHSRNCFLCFPATFVTLFLGCYLSISVAFIACVHCAVA